jgi:hypothetical protein
VGFAQLGHPELDHESAAGSEVTGGVAEASDLFGLGEQIRHRIVDEWTSVAVQARWIHPPQSADWWIQHV